MGSGQGPDPICEGCGRNGIRDFFLDAIFGLNDKKCNAMPAVAAEGFGVGRIYSGYK